MRIKHRGLAIVIVTVVASGCATAYMGTGLVELSADTYRLSRVDGVGKYPDAATMQAALVAEANAFAQSRGKVVVPIASHAQTMHAGHLATADYEFRLAAPGEAATAAAAPATPPVVSAPPPPVADAAPPARAPDVPAPAPATAAAASAAPPPPPPVPSATDAKPSLYNELVMLDDLRRRGILTEAEFQALKTKLIAGK